MACVSLPEPDVRSADKPSLRLQLGMSWPIMTAAYCMWKAQGLLPIIFHRTPNMSLAEFLEWVYAPTVEPVGCYLEEKLVGVGFICQAHRVGDRTVAEVGAAFFKDMPLSQWHTALNMFLDHAFNWRGFDAVYGLSAVDNRAAKLIRKFCGMKTIGNKLPWGEVVPEGTVASELERGAWMFRTYCAGRRQIQ